MLFSQIQPQNTLSDHVKEPDLSEKASTSHGLLIIEKIEEDESETLDKLVDHFITVTDSEKVDLDLTLPVDFQEEFIALNHQVVQQLLTVNQKAEGIISQITNEQDAKLLASKLIAL